MIGNTYSINFWINALKHIIIVSDEHKYSLLLHGNEIVRVHATRRSGMF